VWTNREKEYNSIEPNIYVAIDPSDSGHIYDKDLVRCTLDAIAKKADKNETILMSDMEEYQLVQTVFEDDQLKRSKYMMNFEMSLRLLNDGVEVDSKRKAQQLFRSISNVTVIPSDIYETNQEIIDKSVTIIRDHDQRRIDRLRSLYILRNKTVSVPVTDYLSALLVCNEYKYGGSGA
jgi:hypothetical protein